MDPFSLAWLRSIAFTAGSGILAAVLAVGWIRTETGPAGFFAFIGGAAIGWSTSVGWFFRGLYAAPGRAFEVIPREEAPPNE